MIDVILKRVFHADSDIYTHDWKLDKNTAWRHKPGQRVWVCSRCSAGLHIALTTRNSPRQVSAIASTGSCYGRTMDEALG